MASSMIPNRIRDTTTLVRGALAWATAVASLFGAVSGDARGQWGHEPQSSVLVEGGSLAGVEPLRMSGLSGADEAFVGDGMPSFGPTCTGPGCWPGGVGCAACDGAGCTECCPSALFDTCCDSNRKGIWAGRVDAMILWRESPPDRPIATSPVPGGALDANGLDSTLAAGPRFSLFRINPVTGHAVEATYFRAANFRSERPLADLGVPYRIATPGIFGNPNFAFTTGNANLGSEIKSFELNRHHAWGRNIRFVAGFRWIEWQEEFTFATDDNGIRDFYQSGTINDLYGGHIGLDANILATRWVRFDGFVKAGAYYNNAVQSSLYRTNDPANPGTASVAVGESPASGAFAGDIGLTAVVPIMQNIDVRLGYYALWLSGIAQPTQQLSGQALTPGQPAVGSLNVDGRVLVQGATVGLEGRW